MVAKTEYFLFLACKYQQKPRLCHLNQLLKIVQKWTQTSTLWFVLIDVLTTLSCRYETSGFWASKDRPRFTAEVCGPDTFVLKQRRCSMLTTLTRSIQSAVLQIILLNHLPPLSSDSSVQLARWTHLTTTSLDEGRGRYRAPQIPTSHTTSPEWGWFWPVWLTLMFLWMFTQKSSKNEQLFFVEPGCHGQALLCRTLPWECSSQKTAACVFMWWKWDDGAALGTPSAARRWDGGMCNRPGNAEAFSSACTVPGHLYGTDLQHALLKSFYLLQHQKDWSCKMKR